MYLARFLDADGNAFQLHHIEQLAHAIIRIHPVLRLRDARFIRRLRPSSLGDERKPDTQALAQQLDQLTRELVRNPQKLTNGELRQGLAAMRQLLEHYFAEQGSQVARPPPRRRTGAGCLACAGRHQPHGGRTEQPQHAPDPARDVFHPAAGQGRRQAGSTRPAAAAGGRPGNSSASDHAVGGLGLLNQLPLQRITTTNSSELVSLVPVEHVCRLVRESGRVATYRLGPRGLSAEDGRRIAFHIRFNRPSSLFARCWLLVEGETEVWLLNELARQCGYHFEAEGVRVIEFAQCGLKPLLRFARRMGIEWHALVDGDEAGKSTPIPCAACWTIMKTTSAIG